MTKNELPITKKDIHYDAERGEVTLKREKFDALVAFARDLARDAQALEDEASVARYRARRAKAEAGVLDALLATMPSVNAAVQTWVQKHSIKQLSERAGIPYATCHRIVTERLPKGRVDMVELASLSRVLSEEIESMIKAARAGATEAATPVKRGRS